MLKPLLHLATGFSLVTSGVLTVAGTIPSILFRPASKTPEFNGVCPEYRSTPVPPVERTVSRPVLSEEEPDLIFTEADAEAIASDWRAIGNDMR